MPDYFHSFRDLLKNVQRLFAIAWHNHKLLLVSLAGLSVAGSGVSFLRSGAMAMLIDALAPRPVRSARASGQPLPWRFSPWPLRRT